MNAILDHYLFDAFSNASDNIFVYVTDVSKDLTRWSKKSVEYFGLEGEYIFDTKNKWLEYIHPDDRDAYLKDISAVLTGASEQHNCQYRARNRFGDYVWVECRGSVITDDEGIPKVFAGIMTRLDNQLKYDNLTHLMTSYELHQNYTGMNGSLMLIGVDNFRNINSSHGLVYGNKVIIHFAELIVKNAPENSRVFRLQGDEFIVLTTADTETAKSCCKKIRSICSEADHANGICAFSVSGGIVELTEDKTDFTDLLTKAETAISYAKESASSHAAVYSQKIEDRHIRRNLVAEALIDSIKNDFKGFELFFQPIVSNTNDGVIACESLLRWNPENDAIGACYPGEFIPILESNGHIIQVGYFVMRQAIKQAGIWQKQGRKLSVSFNVSYLQLEDEGFIPELLKTAAEYGVDTSRIVVELTESVFAADTVLVKEAFALLHKNGFRIALDDFGTGHSSFWMLHNLDVDIIKLDQAFIRGLSADNSNTDHAIVETVAFMCSRINYLTVAEGVEDENVWNIINQFNFTGLQGYHFSRPVPLHEFEQFLDRYSA